MAHHGGRIHQPQHQRYQRRRQTRTVAECQPIVVTDEARQAEPSPGAGWKAGGWKAERLEHHVCDNTTTIISTRRLEKKRLWLERVNERVDSRSKTLSENEGECSRMREAANLKGPQKGKRCHTKAGRKR
mmetsp:Transcript_84921/g.177476  ORF Transcript_84921/g.177476 Transcript_84921/m.177476 type:complete len:130 (+) Transcript_84921:128-517(+)